MEPTRRVVLAEYRPTPDVQLSGEQRDLLAALAPSISIAPMAGTTDRFELTPGSVVGAVRLPSLDVTIRPKLPVERVLFLVSYAMARGAWRQLDFPMERNDSLVEAIVPGFVHQLRRALSRGLLQGYRVEEDARHTVRGRLRIAEQVRRRFGILVPAEVTFDDFTEDIEVNRLLKAAIHRLLRLRLRSNTWRHPLRALDGSLATVQLVEYDPRRVPEIQYTRLTERYRPAVELARLILRSCSFELGHGGVTASAFLIDMNAVFEDFVVVALREALGVSDRVLVQGARGRSLHLDIARRVRLEPDLSWWEDGRCRFVGDVKYKRLDLRGFKHADLYQLTAYASAIGLPGGMLIYAAGEGGPAIHEVVNLGKRLEVVSLDVSAPPDAVLREISRLAKSIRRSQMGETLVGAISA